ncbi:aminotransferase DegT [Helicobacter sp. 12S02634-8]|uniref:DegT/DnrJ/EryC1/StrS family aminotransferase n=1 Tax=Helicobacter sp. 12S02634-8 TaxID=1476199 RepID=UPI000BA7014B|nr:DegT/DnrJ/EryC1/StrS family aminotransferase [Helicobacter sp. 12S02634-8]PAF48106.1 aminotransferase DegT [Helicobacter sp. 12S02634-8]
MKKIDFAHLKQGHLEYQNALEEAIRKVIEKAQFIMGEEIEALEEELAHFIGARYAITCSSGTSAILLALLGAGIKRGDEVITTSFSFIAAAEMIALLGAKPVFVDICPRTFLIDPEGIKRAITPKTKAIIPVSLFGMPADLSTINAIASAHQLIVIEDGAQSFGASYAGSKSPHLSAIGTTSFFPAKPLGCYGDGGAVFCDDKEIALKIKALRTHGQTQRYEHHYIGLGARLDTLQAAILRVKLKHYPLQITRRQSAAKLYDTHLQDKSITTPFIPADRESIYAQYCILSPQRPQLEKALKNAHIPYAIHYPKPLHLQQCFAYLGHQKGDFHISEMVSEQILSLPINPYLDTETIQYICKHIT